MPDRETRQTRSTSLFQPAIRTVNAVNGNEIRTSTARLPRLIAARCVIISPRKEEGKRAFN